jgi:hypothetical protein
MPTFQTPYDQHADRNGQSYTFVRSITEPDESHDTEVLPMHVIRFADGTEIEAWPEEVTDPNDIENLTGAEIHAQMRYYIGAIRTDDPTNLAHNAQTLANLTEVLMNTLGLASDTTI